MIRGDVYRAVLSPTQGSEQSGTRPVIIVSRDALNAASPVVIVVPTTDRANKARLYPSHVEVKAGEGGLALDSVILCEQVRTIAKTRMQEHLGHLSKPRMAQVNASLRIALDLST